MFDGCYVYKKFGNYQSLKQKSFNPLFVDQLPWEGCGFGMRSLKLSRNMKQVEIRSSMKAAVEQVIAVEDIIRPLIPQSTVDILKVQRRFEYRQYEPEINVILEKFLVNNVDMLKHSLTGSKERNTAIALQRFLNCKFYPFCILMEKGGRVELVAQSYQTFRQWVDGLNYLVKNKKTIVRTKAKAF